MAKTLASKQDSQVPRLSFAEKGRGAAISSFLLIPKYHEERQFPAFYEPGAEWEGPGETWWVDADATWCIGDLGRL